MLIEVVEVLVGLTVRFSVAALSHPTLLVRWAVWLPAAVNVSPFHVYGNKLEQMLIEVVEVLVGLTVSVSVAALSHPTLLVRCAVWLPAAVNVSPFHVYGNKLEQMLRLVVEVLVGLTVNVNVAALSH